MKKILLVTRPIAPPWDEASKNFAYNLARNINNRDFELHLMTKGILPELPEEIIQENIYTLSRNDFSMSQKIRSLFFQIKKRKSFDIAHYFFTPTRLNSFVIKNLIKNEKLKSIQTIATLREDLFSDKEIKDLIFADNIITYSDYAKNKLRSLGLQKVKRVYPGISLETYRPLPKNEKILREFNFSPEDFVIHFSGEYVRLGAMDDVVDSFILVSQKIKNAKLLLAVRVKNEKDAEKKKKVIAKLQSFNLLEKTAFCDDGRHPMEDIYNLADISLFPVRDMFGKFDVPLVVIEAMACAKPVIISDIPILKEFANEKNSVTIKSGRADELSSTILNLYADSKKRKVLGENGNIFVRENFDIKKIGSLYAKIYADL